MTTSTPARLLVLSTSGAPRDASVHDVLRWPVVGRFLRWPRSRLAMQLVLLVASIVMIAHGLFGPQLAPKNLATVLTWVHYRGVLVLTLLAAGNLFCMACPLLLPRELARRWFKPVLNWPRRLRNKGLAIVLFVTILFVYEWYDLWSWPLGTALLILGYFAVATGVDALFKHASFCKFVCPIGQFNFIASTVSPLEVRIRDAGVCASCETLDCIKGTRSTGAGVIQRGCELALFQPMKHGNMDCTFCMDCVYACPHDNIAMATRLPGSELWADPPRSGVGRYSKRADLGLLGVLFTFGALLNAFAMVSPIYALQAALARWMGTTNEAPVLGAIFGIALVLEPLVLLGLAAALTRRWTGSPESLLALTTRHSYALIPLGFGIWVAHYGFHLLTGLLTFVPVTQSALADVGLPLLGPPLWRLAGLAPSQVYPLEIGILALGLLGSLLVAYRIAERDHPGRATWAFVPWATVCIVLAVAAMVLLGQPMEMRATFLGG